MAVYVSPPPPAQLVEGEVLTGIIDGTNKIFTTTDKFIMEFGGVNIKVYVNGVRQKFLDDYSVSESIPGAGFDTITFLIAPKVEDNLLSDYEIAEV